MLSDKNGNFLVRWGVSTVTITKSYREHREEVMAILGKKCARCSFSDERALQIDHVHGFGSVHRANAPWPVIFEQMKNNPEEFQTLCANCNSIKAIENEEFLSPFRDVSKSSQKTLQYRRKRWEHFRETIFSFTGCRCARCEFSDRRALQIDHVEAIGPWRLPGEKEYKRIIEDLRCGTVRVQTLCANCNWIKRAENHEFPYTLADYELSTLHAIN